jgi:hypothetical protein
MYFAAFLIQDKSIGAGCNWVKIFETNALWKALKPPRGRVRDPVKEDNISNATLKLLS